MKAFEALSDIIRNRRSIKPADMNGRVIPKEQVEQLLELANWAPTHGRTEPWRFVVYAGEGKKQYCHDHAELYRNNTAPEKFTQAKYEGLQKQGDNLSHYVITYMKRSSGNNSIPAIEEIAAVSAAMQNILLGAAALDIAALWSTGGMILQPAMKEYLGLGEEDTILGSIMLGYSDKPLPPAKRNIPLGEKISWHG